MSLIVCPEATAAAVGGEILANGGNAADAAVAAAFAQCVVSPVMCSLSGTAIVMHMDAQGRAIVLNGEAAIGSAPVPAQWRDGAVERSEKIGRFHVASEDNQIGVSATMVPGLVAACSQMHQRFGSQRLSWPDLLRPAIGLASDGFVLDASLARSWSVNMEPTQPGYPSIREKFDRDTGAAAIFLADGARPYREGEKLRQGDLASTLEQLARAGAEDFYSGEIAEAMALDLERRGSLVRAADLSSYEVIEQAPLHSRYCNYTVWTTPPPSPGVQLLEMLAILDEVGIDMGSMFDTSNINVMCQVMRAGFSDNRDIKALDIKDAVDWAATVMSPERHQKWASRIRRMTPIHGPPAAASTGTTHLVVYDDDGNAVSFTHSVGSGGGSGAVTPGLGFIHNNFLGHFDPRPGRPMSIAAGRRIGSGLPTIVEDGGRIRLLIGAPGGSRIITSVFQVIADVLGRATSIGEAVMRKRFHSEEDDIIHLEPGLGRDVADELTGLGNVVKENSYQARVQAIEIDRDGNALPGIDPRGGAAANAAGLWDRLGVT